MRGAAQGRTGGDGAGQAAGNCASLCLPRTHFKKYFHLLLLLNPLPACLMALAMTEFSNRKQSPTIAVSAMALEFDLISTQPRKRIFSVVIIF